jgi:hypothetical protein
MKQARGLSIIDRGIAETEAFLARHRRGYLRGVGAELGINDLRYLAMREIAELVEMVREMDAAALRAAQQ